MDETSPNQQRRGRGRPRSETAESHNTIMEAVYELLQERSVRDLTMLPNGDLVVAGQFTASGSSTLSRIARWSGNSWNPFASGMSHTTNPTPFVDTIIVEPGTSNVLAGGLFTSPGAGIARWTGTAWTTLGVGFNNTVRALAKLPNGDIIAGGDFTMSGSAPIKNIARWNGSAWVELGGGVSGALSGLDVRVWALLPLPNGFLIAGGDFKSAGPTTPTPPGPTEVNGIALWNGTSWSRLGSGVNGRVFALARMSNGDIAVGGDFNLAGGIRSSDIAYYRFNAGALSITSQPADTAVLPSGAASFTLAASGDGSLAYQWRRDGANLVNGGRFSGVTSVTLSLTGITTSDQGLYDCVVTNVCGSSVISRAAILTCTPIINVQPPSRVALSGTGATFGVEVPAAATNTYRWRRGGVVLADIPGRIGGSGTRTLQLLANDPTLAGSYDLLIQNACGSTVSAVVQVVTGIGTECPADFNQDGGVDGSDIEHFFIFWQQGDAFADVNQDGGIDGADVEAFVNAWELGC